MITRYVKKNVRYFRSLMKKLYSAASFRVRILLLRGHTCTWQYIRISCCVAVPACGRSGLWHFRSVAVPVVAVSVCGRFGLSPFLFVAVSVCRRYDLLPIYITWVAVRIWFFWYFLFVLLLWSPFTNLVSESKACINNHTYCWCRMYSHIYANGCSLKSRWRWCMHE